MNHRYFQQQRKGKKKKRKKRRKRKRIIPIADKRFLVEKPAIDNHRKPIIDSRMNHRYFQQQTLIKTPRNSIKRVEKGKMRAKGKRRERENGWNIEDERASAFDSTPNQKKVSESCQNEGEGGVNGEDYEGNVAKTVSGLECQKWTEQKPHKHKFSDLGEHNFCRNPDDHKGVWCYTTDKNKRWELCDVPKCDIDCQTGNGEDYKGEVDKTESGKECQDWTLQKPHKHKFEDVGEHSFCRNPDNHTGVWCYTTDKKKRWENLMSQSVKT